LIPCKLFQAVRVGLIPFHFPKIMDWLPKTYVPIELKRLGLGTGLAI
jgi:hypothetical protein